MQKTSSAFKKPKESLSLKKVKDLTGIIWNCSNLIDQNVNERKTLRLVEKYTHQEFKELGEKYENINGVNDLLTDL